MRCPNIMGRIVVGASVLGFGQTDVFGQCQLRELTASHAAGPYTQTIDTDAETLLVTGAHVHSDWSMVDDALTGGGPASECGNGVCEAEEIAENCPVDCPSNGESTRSTDALGFEVHSVGPTGACTIAAAQATTWYVDNDNCPGPGTGTQADPFCMIQDGIDAAVNGDECLVAPGTYNEKINFLGKAITLRSSGGADVTTIDGSGLNDSVVKCKSDEGSGTVLDGFTITGGTGDPSFPSPRGGGMVNSFSSPTVTNCTFSGNTTSGGGMYNVYSSPTVTNCTFTGNTGVMGGGMWNSLSSPLVKSCTFTYNLACIGGAISNTNDASPVLLNCTFTGNSAARGGALQFAFGSNGTVINCAFSGNAAGSYGGAMVNQVGSSPTVTNCILWGDSPEEIFNASSFPPCTPTISFSDLQGGLPVGAIDGGGNISADPLFVDADGVDNVPGTEDDDLRLLAGSPAIDAADNTAVPMGVTTDLDGNPRFIDDPATPDSGNGTPPIVDMGAYEFHQVCGNGVIDPGEECDDGNTDDGDCCSSTCQFEADGEPCDLDSDLCTIDECDGAGTCECTGSDVECQDPVPPCEGGQHCVPATGQCVDDPDAYYGEPCPDDGNECTDDWCDGNGNCIHPDNGLCGVCCLPDLPKLGRPICNDDMIEDTCVANDGVFVVGPGSECLGDSDGDTVDDQCDVCPGEDDLADMDRNGIQDCLDPNFIPTVSTWGLVVLALLLLTVAKIYFGRRRPVRGAVPM